MTVHFFVAGAVATQVLADVEETEKPVLHSVERFVSQASQHGLIGRPTKGAAARALIAVSVSIGWKGDACAVCRNFALLRGEIRSGRHALRAHDLVVGIAD